MLLFRYRAIVDKSFHSVLEWVVCQKQFRTCLDQDEKEDEILAGYMHYAL